MCPECGEPMVGYELEGVEIDQCLTCRGTWLDAGELEQISERAGVESADLSRALAGRQRGRRTRRRCPRCPRHLREIDIGQTETVSVDRCPWAHGLWFDRGEVQAAVRSFAGGQAGEVAHFFADLFASENETA
ncbi:MAG: zf-TFIIB domain-containing protein [Acidobacteriota bacterium]